MRLWARILVIVGLAAWAAAPGVAGEQIVAGLSKDNVQITANFDGSSILIYGAIKRDAPAPQTPPAVIITVAGPDTPVIVRKKEHVVGIWINGETVNVKSAPSFYAVESSGPLKTSLTKTDDQRYRVSLPYQIDTTGIAAQTSDPQAFLDGLMRVRTDGGLYRVGEGSVQVVDDTLFRADVSLPSNLVEGAYIVRMFITRNGEVVDHKDLTLEVRKAGLERFLYRLSVNQPLIYGLISLIIAAFAGWFASFAFRLLRR